MNKAYIHLVIPIAILIGGLSLYYFLGVAFYSIEVDPKIETKLLSALQKDAVRSTDPVIIHLINANNARSKSIEELAAGFGKMILSGTFCLFILSVFRELSVYKYAQKDS